MRDSGGVTAVLLAAGRSRRMGALKALLPFGGRTVARACVENLLEAGAEEVVVVLGHRAEEVRAELERDDARVRFAFNREEGSEMGVSVARGVEAVAPDARAVLVALVDQPAVPPSAIGSLIDAWRERSARLVVPVWEGRGGHPVLIDLAFKEELLNVVPREGLRSLLDGHREEVLRLPAPSPYVARDMDTWDEYVSLHTEVFGRPPEVDFRPVE